MIEFICRVCLSFDKKDKLVSLVENSISGGLNCYGQSVMAFANVVIQKDDIFPKSICCNCLYLLKKAISFKLLCESSQKTLETFTQNSQQAYSDEKIQQYLVEALLFNTYFPLAQDRKKPKVLEDSKLKMVEVEIFCDQNKRKTNCKTAAKSVKKEVQVKREIVQNSEFSDLEIFQDLEHDMSQDGDIILNKFEEILQDDPAVFGKSTYLGYKITDINKKYAKKKCKTIGSAADNSSNFGYDGEANKKIHLFKKKKLNNELSNNNNTESSYLQIEPKIKKKRKGPIKVNKTCPFCNKVLANLVSYKRHMIKHEGGGGWVCELCGKNYPDQGGFQYHQAMKHGVGPCLKCKQCDYKAPSKSYLVEHERLHTGERPFSCEKCGLTFRRQAIWKKHIVHHEEKTVKCEQCSKMFYLKSDMVAHYNIVHQRKHMYVCPKCGALYADNSSVRIHLTKRHGIPREDQGKIEKVNVSKGLTSGTEQE